MVHSSIVVEAREIGTTTKLGLLKLKFSPAVKRGRLLRQILMPMLEKDIIDYMAKKSDSKSR